MSLLPASVRWRQAVDWRETIMSKFSCFFSSLLVFGFFSSLLDVKYKSATDLTWKIYSGEKQKHLLQLSNNTPIPRSTYPLLLVHRPININNYSLGVWVQSPSVRAGGWGGGGRGHLFGVVFSVCHYSFKCDSADVASGRGRRHQFSRGPACPVATAAALPSPRTTFQPSGHREALAGPRLVTCLFVCAHFHRVCTSPQPL